MSNITTMSMIPLMILPLPYHVKMAATVEYAIQIRKLMAVLLRECNTSSDASRDAQVVRQYVVTVIECFTRKLKKPRLFGLFSITKKVLNDTVLPALNETVDTQAYNVQVIDFIDVLKRDTWHSPGV